VEIGTDATRPMEPTRARTAVRRRFIDGLRAAEREKRRGRLVTSPVGEAAAPAGVDDLADVFALLSDRERAAVVLRYVDDLPVAEVARQLSSTVRSTESLLARARARVRAAEGARCLSPGSTTWRHRRRDRHLSSGSACGGT
jgi:DNA-directed RNA polymerase specialized sigma24 family protein